MNDRRGCSQPDVLHVSHHGADNGTSDELLKMLAPKLAVISMGARGNSGSATAWGHGHARASGLRAMQEAHMSYRASALRRHSGPPMRKNRRSGT